uniref:Ribonuclease P protein subunit p29 n=1 Tax=Anthurium amnicola TaxID=1678845 RepID=A0A1D1YH40_9ARAE
MATDVGASPVISAQRKRALEVLERRHLATKSESSQQEDKNKKRAPDEEREEKRRKGGHSTSHGHTATHGFAGVSGEEAHAAYCDLSQNVHDNLVKPQVQHSKGRVTIVNNVIHDLLQNGDSAQKYLQGSRNIKIDNVLLLDDFVPASSTLRDAREKHLQSHSKRSKKHMSMRQHRLCGSFDFPRKFWKFDRFKPCHEMWKEYILKLIKESGKHQLGHILLTAILEGAFLQVVECKAAAFTGVRGIMIRETAETFGVITLDDKFRVVPKRGSVFLFQAGCWKITLFGDKFSGKCRSKI